MLPPVHATLYIDVQLRDYLSKSLQHCSTRHAADDMLHHLKRSTTPGGQEQPYGVRKPGSGQDVAVVQFPKAKIQF